MRFLTLALAVGLAAAFPVAASAPKGSDQPPVDVSIAVSPEPVAPGANAAVTVTLKPKAGIKLNKYPKIKLVVPVAPGVVDAAEGSIGNTAPPPANDLEANYYKGHVDPLTVTVHVDKGATPGEHPVPAKLSYFYCVAASGYCAPAKVDVELPVRVR